MRLLATWTAALVLTVVATAAGCGSSNMKPDAGAGTMDGGKMTSDGKMMSDGKTMSDGKMMDGKMMDGKTMDGKTSGEMK